MCGSVCGSHYLQTLFHKTRALTRRRPTHMQHVSTLTQHPLLTSLILPRPSSACSRPDGSRPRSDNSDGVRLQRTWNTTLTACRDRSQNETTQQSARAASSSGADVQAWSIVKNSATTADVQLMIVHASAMQAQAWSGGRPSASGCLLKRGAENNGSRRNLPALASLRRFSTVAGLHKCVQ